MADLPATRTVRCEHCRGTGQIEVAADETPCPGVITVGSEQIVCYASRQHPGRPHMAILCDPCPDCGQYEECDVSCATYPAEPARRNLTDWWWWTDDALTVTRAALGAGQPWRNEFQPDSPWAQRAA